MPVKLSSLTTRQNVLSVQLSTGDTLEFRVRPWTRKIARLLRDAGQPANDGEIFAEYLPRFLAELIEWWDVVDETDASISPSEELLGAMHFPDLVRIRDAAQEYLFPNSATAETSGDGSPAAESSVPSPDGTTTSPSPAGPASA